MAGGLGVLTPSSLGPPALMQQWGGLVQGPGESRVLIAEAQGSLLCPLQPLTIPSFTRK